jgi:hypothetical protein
LLALIVYSLYLSSADHWAQYVIITGVAWWNIEKGYTDWLDPAEMICKYMPIGVTAVLLLGGYNASMYLIACVACGLSYPLLHDIKMPRYDFYARFIVGATVLGGLHLL